MSGYPLVIEGTMISAVVVGGGRVAVRKAEALLGAGARVRIVALAIDPSLEARSRVEPRLAIRRAAYSADVLDGATLVIAATNDALVNAAIAADAKACGLLVNVADAPEAGNCVTPAVHRAGDLVVAVSAGGVPAAAARIRDAIGALLGDAVADAVGQLASLRRDLLTRGERDRWASASTDLLGDAFVEQVREGTFAARIGKWR
jgi:precorrin-2 dehydrogenase